MLRLFFIFLLAWVSVPVQAAVTAFVNVNVVPMDVERTLLDYTVIVDGETITQIGPASKVKVPVGARIIEGMGAFLTPGLADMHVHLNIDPSPDFMRLFLAQGVTTIRNLNGLKEHLGWREEVNRGARIGPTIYTGGPVIVGPPDRSMVWVFWALIVGLLFITAASVWAVCWLRRRLHGQKEQAKRLRKLVLPGSVAVLIVAAVLIISNSIPLNIYTSLEYPFAYIPNTEERARGEVRRQMQAGYDVIKLYDWMTPEQYMGALDEARKLGAYTVAHLDHDIEAVFAAGLNEVAHVDEFMDSHLMEKISPRAFKPVVFNFDLIPTTVASVVKYDVMVVSNLVTDTIAFEYLEVGPSYYDRQEYHVIRPETVKQWSGPDSRVVRWQGQQSWRRNTLQTFLIKMIQSLHAAKVPILTGTDTGVEAGLPLHIHRELELLVDAGLSPYEALSAATKNARLSVNRMGINDQFGEISVGQRADLVLLESNPLVNISATRQRMGVMSRGHWYTKDRLDQLVAQLVSTY